MHAIFEESLALTISERSHGAAQLTTCLQLCDVVSDSPLSALISRWCKQPLSSGNIRKATFLGRRVY